MKTKLKPSFIWQFCMALLVLVGCNQAEVAKLRSENADLMGKVEELEYKSDLKDSTINDFFKDFNEIEANLREIKKKEQGLVSKKVGSGDLPKSDKERIISDIKSINELLSENAKKIKGLNAKLKNANVNISEFQRMIASLEASVSEKNMEIDQLRSNLANANDALSALNDLYIESVMEAEARQEELNTAFYAFGSFKELKENNVLTKEGGLVGIGATKTLKEDFNRGYFKEIDIQQSTSIPLYSAKVKMVTNHPPKSYKLEMENDTYTLKISNPDLFWSTSKYLVIITG
ncbi:MAG: hypothetical protein ACPF8V_10595 [Luteibaculum sp.]